MDAPVASADTPKARLIDQLKVSAGGILGATIVVPIVLTNWTPLWFALGWGAAYFTQSAIFVGVVSYFGERFDRLWWTICTSALFFSVIMAVFVWGRDHPSATWIAAMIGFAYIAFEVATLPYLKMSHWWLGVTVVSVGIALLAFATVHPAVGIASVPVLATMITVAGRNTRLRDDLDRQLVETEARLLTDPLTGLRNRRGFEAELATLDGQPATIAIFDADRFKLINDTQGHGVGDQVLRVIAGHLRSTLPDYWTIARHGGDEFVAVTAGDVDIDENVVAPLQMPLSERAGHVRVTLSAGLATGTLSGSGDRLLSEAGHALRYAKRECQQMVRSAGALRDRFERSVSITSVNGVDSPIVPVAQVIVDERGVVGCELLARWQTPDGSLIAPAHFMDMLIENGLHGQLDDLMLEHAVDVIAKLDEIGIDAFVSANVAASHLLDPELAARVKHLLESRDVAAERLMVEITESERLGADRRWEGAAKGLRDLGIMLAIDDFGAGYSSIARLQNLPITHLKLDRSLVTSGGGPLGEIVRGVTRFCRSSNIGVIAEGIETVEDHRTMSDADVSIYQGYLFGRPQRVSDFLRDVVERSGGATAAVVTEQLSGPSIEPSSN